MYIDEDIIVVWNDKSVPVLTATLKTISAAGITVVKDKELLCIPNTSIRVCYQDVQ